MNDFDEEHSNEISHMEEKYEDHISAIFDELNNTEDESIDGAASETYFMPFFNEPDPIRKYKFSEKRNKEFDKKIESIPFEPTIHPQYNFINYVCQLDSYIKHHMTGRKGINKEQLVQIIKCHFTEYEWKQIENVPPNEMMNVYSMKCYSIDQRIRDYCDRLLFMNDARTPWKAMELQEKMACTPLGRVYLALYETPISAQEHFYIKFQSYFNSYGLFNPKYIIMAINSHSERHDQAKYKKISEISEAMMIEIGKARLLEINEPRPMWEAIGLASRPEILRNRGYMPSRDRREDVPMLRQINSTNYRIAKHLREPYTGLTLRECFLPRR